MSTPNYPAERVARYVAALRNADTYAQLGDPRDLQRFAHAVMAVADAETDPVYRSGYNTGRMHAGAAKNEALTTLRVIHEDMAKCRAGGDEWASEWLGDFWTRFPLPLRAIAGDDDALTELAARADEAGGAG